VTGRAAAMAGLSTRVMRRCQSPDGPAPAAARETAKRPLRWLAGGVWHGSWSIQKGRPAAV
jgi:hypothetical protein